MTPVRAKRNSKAPNRFSSDNSRIETSNIPGETIIDYNDNTTSTTHSLAPINRQIKLKPVMREPLKVKLPKLKRSHLKQTKEHTVKNNLNEVKIHKIKLPSLSKKSKPKTHSNKDDSHGKSKSNLQQESIADSARKLFGSDLSSLNDSRESSISFKSPTKSATTCFTANPKIDISKKVSSPKLDVSSATKSSDDYKSSCNLSSDDGEADTSAGMEIVVSHTEQPNGSGIRCPCGVDDDLGVMVECESCSTWQHGHCINVGTEAEAEAYMGYTCAFCVLPQGKSSESLRELTIGDKFQSRFKLLESMRKRSANSADNQQANICTTGTLETAAPFTPDELNMATKDLQRVLNSLRIKWRLLTSQAYEMELRIWQNPVWSDELQVKTDQDKTHYFIDRCKANLKLNIRNMVEKMEERCLLIGYAISKAKSNLLSQNVIESNKTDESKLESVRQSLDAISDGVKEFKNKLKYHSI